MAEVLKLNLQDWISSAAQVNGQAEHLAGEFVAADDRAGAAQWGWQGASAMALAAKMDAWLQTSTRLARRVGDHGCQLNEAAIGHAAAEAERARALADVAAAADGAAGPSKAN